VRPGQYHATQYGSQETQPHQGWRAGTGLPRGATRFAIISDVPGDLLDLIASGPTVEDRSTPEDALAVLEKFSAREAGISPAVFERLKRIPPKGGTTSAVCKVMNLIIGSNATAVDAAGMEAERRGYSHAMISAREPEGRQKRSDDTWPRWPGRCAGRRVRIASLAAANRSCNWSMPRGGKRRPEPATGPGGAGSILGRRRAGCGVSIRRDRRRRRSTDAAGAYFDAVILAASREHGLSPRELLARNDAYNFFAPLDALLKTGPTHTNVCDLRVVITRQT